VLVVYFGYTTCPDVCPTTLADMHRAIARIGDDAKRVEVAFVTVDLARDTPDVLAPFLAAFVANGHPLRPASEAQLAAAEHALGASSSVTRGADGELEVSHSGTGYLVDAGGHVVGEWPFGTAPERMAHDLKALLSGGTR
jgi:protein SCO1/2